MITYNEWWHACQLVHQLIFSIDLKNPTKKEKCKNLPTNNNGIEAVTNTQVKAKATDIVQLMNSCPKSNCYFQRWKKGNTKTKKLVAQCIEKDDLGMILNLFTSTCPRLENCKSHFNLILALWSVLFNFHVN